MRDFILNVLKHQSKYIHESLTYNDLNKIQELVMDSLNLTNLNELRDKYEGVAFMDKFSLKIFGIIALEKRFKVEYIDWNTLNPRNYTPRLVIDGQAIDVISSEYGEFPVIDKVNERPAIIVIKRDRKDVWICGYADVDTLNSNQSDKFMKGSTLKANESKTTFIGYGHLKPFKSVEELESLVKS